MLMYLDFTCYYTVQRSILIVMWYYSVTLDCNYMSIYYQTNRSFFHSPHRRPPHESPPPTSPMSPLARTACGAFAFVAGCSARASGVCSSAAGLCGAARVGCVPLAWGPFTRSTDVPPACTRCGHLRVQRERRMHGAVGASAFAAHGAAARWIVRRRAWV